MKFWIGQHKSLLPWNLLKTLTRNLGKEQLLLIIRAVGQRAEGFISRINKHRPLLSSVGILPNQLRAILKDSTPYFEEAFEDISYTLVFHSYQIWKTRKADV